MLAGRLPASRSALVPLRTAGLVLNVNARNPDTTPGAPKWIALWWVTPNGRLFLEEPEP